MARGYGFGTRRSGQVMILFPAAVVFLCCIAAITVDVGSFCACKARLQNGADAASLAAMLEVWEQRRAGCGEGAARAAGEDEAERLAGLNCPLGRVEVTFGLYDGTDFTASGSGIAANACKVRAMRDADAPGGAQSTFFASIFGLVEADLGASATATFVRASDLIPFCIHREDVGHPGDELIMYDDNEITPGVFGLIDFDGGANSADDSVEWTANGYQGDLFIDPQAGFITLQGNPGFEATLNKPIDDRIEAASPVVGCIYRDVRGGGANTEFDVVGFVKMVITERGKSKVEGDPRKYVAAEILGKYIIGEDQVYGELYHFMNLQLVQ
jgi:hypothetical protein